MCFGASGFSAARYASLAQRTTASRRAAALRSRGASTVTCNQDADFDFVVVFGFAASPFVVAAGAVRPRVSHADGSRLQDQRRVGGDFATRGIRASRAVDSRRPDVILRGGGGSAEHLHDGAIPLRLFREIAAPKRAAAGRSRTSSERRARNPPPRPLRRRRGSPPPAGVTGRAPPPTRFRARPEPEGKAPAVDDARRARGDGVTGDGSPGSLGGFAFGTGTNAARNRIPDACAVSPRAGSSGPSAGCDARTFSADATMVTRSKTLGSGRASGCFGCEARRSRVFSRRDESRREATRNRERTIEANEARGDRR